MQDKYKIMNALEIQNLNKSFGTKEVLKDVNFSMASGEVVGLVGENGAGKTTLMRCVMGLLNFSGQIRVCGYDISSERQAALQNIGFLPENNPLYDDLYATEYLAEVGSYYGMSGQESRKRAESLLERLSLDEYMRQRIGTLSKGTRQRVGLAAALMHKPKLLILDEPTTGLDPKQLAEFHQLINDIKTDCAILLSTHIMQEITAVCSRVVLLYNAELKESTPEEINSIFRI